ncbi:MAG TPA: hypothetical protein VF258_06385 [Luteolibacter sp.]
MKKIPCNALVFLMVGANPILAMDADKIPANRTTAGDDGGIEDAYFNRDEWSLTANLIWASRYVPDGFSVGGNHPAWQPDIKIGTPIPGVTLMLRSSIQAERAQKASDEYDFILIYSRDFCEDSPFAVTVDTGYHLFVFPNSSITEDRYGNAISSHDLLGQKIWAGFSLPELFPLGDAFLVTSYRYSYWIPFDGELFEPGGMHTLRLDYSHGVPIFIPGTKLQSVFIGGTMNYHDGFFGVEPGWSHATMNAGAAADITDGLSASISFNYQWSFTESVNPEDVFWYTASITCEF